MKVAGIICEYNPFHNGHKLHVGSTARHGASHIISVMSGSFVQRGESAVMSKFARAECAVQNGVDLVIELPVVWSTANAQNFARGGCSILNALGCVDFLSFGSECGDIDRLERASDILRTDEFSVLLKDRLNEGMSFASARESAVSALSDDVSVLRTPNDILAIEYINSLKELSCKMELFAVKRGGAEHDSHMQSGCIASSSLIREKIRKNESFYEFVPENTVKIIENELNNSRFPADFSKLETALLAALRRMTAEQIRNAPDISEGIENRIYSAVRDGASLAEIYNKAKTKRYSHARIRRIILNSFLGINSDDVKSDPPYARVLAFNERGAEILRAAKKKTKIPIITKVSQIKALDGCAKRIFALESYATDVFSLTMPKASVCGEDYTHKLGLI